MDYLQMAIAHVAAQNKAENEAAGQFTLGRLIKELEALPQDAPCDLGDADSYRGYYEQLSFERGRERTVADALAEAKEAMGQCFQGYKGGDFWMTGKTWVWIAPYGRCGERLIGLELRDGRVVVQTAPDEPAEAGPADVTGARHPRT